MLRVNEGTKTAIRYVKSGTSLLTAVTAHAAGWDLSAHYPQNPRPEREGNERIQTGRRRKSSLASRNGEPNATQRASKKRTFDFGGNKLQVSCTSEVFGIRDNNENGDFFECHLPL